MNDYLQSKKESERRKRRRKVRIIITACIGLLVIAAGIAFLHSSALDIHTILVQGDATIPSQDIISLTQTTLRPHGLLASLLVSTKSIFLLSKEDIQQSIMQAYPSIKSVDVSHGIFGGAVTITLYQREKYGLWCTPQEHHIISSPTSASSTTPLPSDVKGATSTPSQQPLAYTSCWWFDEQGIVFSSAPLMQGNAVNTVMDNYGAPITIGSAILSQDETHHLMEIFQSLDAIHAPVRTLIYDTPQLEEVQTASMHGYPVIYFTLTQNPQFALDAIKNIGDISALSYIDLRVANRIYYK